MENILVFLFILFLLFVIVLMARDNSVPEVRGHWQHYFDDFLYSPKEFYAAIETIIRSKELPGVSTSRITYGEGGLLSPRREYLRVSREQTVFDICAAPYAKGFFISSWQGELPNLKLHIVHPRYSMYLKLMIDEATSKPFSATTHPLHPAEKSFKNETIKASRLKYCRDVSKPIKDTSLSVLRDDSDVQGKLFE